MQKYLKVIIALVGLFSIISCKKSDSTGTPATNNPVPVLSSISPTAVIAGSAQFNLTVNGSNFIAGSKVQWNGITLTTTYVGVSQLKAAVSAALVVNPGTATITINNPTPGGGNSNSSVFTITSVSGNPVPSVTVLTPASTTAGSPTITLTVGGNNFVSNSIIKWNGTSLATVYVSSSQLTAVVDATLLTTASVAAVTVYNPSPAGGTSGTLPFTINNSTSTHKKYLFDATKAETAGNADWVIDADGGTPQRTPTPAQSTITSSTAETYWTGALSSWGIALVKLGETVETLPSSGTITYGNASNAQDLSNYDVFVVDEPNIRFTTSEKQAILSFVQNGGGLFMVSDHTISDRNGDGWDSPDIWNDFMTNNGVISNPFGFSVDLTNISETSSNVLSGNPTNPLLHGTMGNVTQLKFNGGATLTLNTSVNSSVQGLVWQTGYAQNSTHVMSATSTYGTGRIYVVTDSSPIDDGSGDPNDMLYDGYITDAAGNHRKLLMNITIWLATTTVTNVDEINIAHDFNICPNPANDKTVCSSKDFLSAIINLYDVTGKLISKNNFETSNQTVDVSTLQDGIYFLNFTNEHFSSTKKIVVLHH